MLLMTAVAADFAEARSLEGQVRDSRTHAGLPFVKLELQNSSSRVGIEYSDNDGRFVFGNVAPGTYKLSATLQGYEGVAVAVDTTYQNRVEVELTRPAPPVRPLLPTVSVREYLVPEAARKEFDRAQKDIDRDNCVSAIKHLQNSLRLYDQNAAALNDLGNCRRKLGELQSAEAAFRQAMALSNAPYIAMNLAETLTAQQRFGDAEAMLKEVIEKSVDKGHLYYALAVAYFKENRLGDAEAAAIQADLGRHLPDLHLLLAKIYIKSGREEAAGQLELYLKEAPNGRESKAVRELLKSMQQP
jgi:tetratricopeptide (TPR) repeat protein